MFISFLDFFFWFTGIQKQTQILTLLKTTKEKKFSVIFIWFPQFFFRVTAIQMNSNPRFGGRKQQK